MASSTTTPLVAPPRDIDRPHIVDQLIGERAGGLRANAALWALVRRFGFPILGYRRAVRMADLVAPMAGRMTMNWMSATLRLRVSTDGVVDLPERGPALVVANHPGGIADGVALWDALVDRRPDLTFFANRDALRVNPGLSDFVVPVEWRDEHRSREKNRETFKAAAEAFRAGRVVVMFPAGRIAQIDWNERRLIDREWAASPISFARKFDAPIVPVGVRSRMSTLYYALALVSRELRDMTLFHELLRAEGARYRLRFGAPVRVDELPEDPLAAARRLKLTCEALATRF